MPAKEIVFLYTKNFHWKDGNNKIAFKNKPEIDRVYVAAIEPDSGFYQLLLPSKGDSLGIVLDELDADSKQWVCEFIPITYTNILEFDIHPDDLKMITEELDNSTSSKNIPVTLDGDPIEDDNYARDKQIDYTVMDSLENLRDTDRLAYETVAGLVQYLSTKMAMQEGDTFVDNMILEGYGLGKGGSMALILNELQGYMMDEDEPHKLVRSIYYIMLEIIRYKLNKKDE